MFTAMLLYYIVEEAMEIKANKLAYFLSFWNCLDIFVILVNQKVPSLLCICHCLLSTTDISRHGHLQYLQIHRG